jgi:hypothetical protein
LLARDLGAGRTRERQRVTASRKRPSVGLDQREQCLQVDPAIGSRPRTALELGERQQIADERAHALRLLRHHHQHALALDLGQRQVRQRLDEARQHRQRRADLVRHVGDEVAPHALGALFLGHVLRQHQLHVVAIGPDQHGEGRPAARRLERHRRLVVAALQVGHEGRRPHEVGDGLSPVALRIEGEVIGGARIEPLDLPLRIEQQDPVRRCLDGRQKLRQAGSLDAHVLIGSAQRALDAVAELSPEAGIARCRTLLASAQPVEEPITAQPVEDRDRGDRNRASDEDAGHRRFATAEQQAGEAAERHRREADDQPPDEPAHATLVAGIAITPAESTDTLRRAPFR